MTKQDNPTVLPPAAVRALREADQRRKLAEQNKIEPPIEYKGRKGPDPVRYGDWEKKGIVSDF